MGKFYTNTLALTNIGLLMYAYGDDIKAQEYYQKALQADPLHYDAIWNYSSSLLRQCSAGQSQEWSTAWKMYEYRFKRSQPTKCNRHLPLWDGSIVDSICVLAEQGIGDKIQFGRYISLLKDYCDKIYVECHESLDVFFSDYECVRVPTGSYGIPLCSLPGRFVNIPSEKYLPFTWTGGEKTAVCWWGSPTHANNKYRSCSPHYFKDLAESTGLEMVAITNDPKLLVPKNIEKRVVSNWTECVAKLNMCKQLISVDTSLVHLAGSLGIPTIMLQPYKETDFRWGYGGSNMWYNSVFVVENNQNWDLAFKKVKECI
jgi:hypothetical protein